MLRFSEACASININFAESHSFQLQRSKILILIFYVALLGGLCRFVNVPASEKRNINSCKAAKRKPASEKRNITSQTYIIFIQKIQKGIHL
jgi:hypothetical protein